MDALFESIKPEHFSTCFPSNRRSNTRVRNLKKCKKIYKKRKTKTNYTPNPEFINEIRNSFGAVTIIPKKKGQIRFLIPSPPFIPTYDRSLAAHFHYMDTLKARETLYPLNSLNSKMSEIYEQNLYNQQRIRRSVQKCVNRMFIRSIDKKPIDNCDLYTTLPIPKQSCVTVYDLKHKTKNVFHTHTAIKIIESALYYSSYGIARPVNPKNPYTNIPWNIIQLISMVRQISNNLLFNHTFCPLDIQKFRRSRYCIGRFLTQNTHHLSILAAKDLFKHKEDPVTLDITREILEDLYRETNIRTTLISIVLQRKLPERYLKEWDEVIFATFLEQNLKILIGRFKHLDDILDAFVTIHESSMQYRRIIRRTTQRSVEGAVTTETIATNALDNLISTLSHTLNLPVNSVSETNVQHNESTITTVNTIDNTQRIAESVAETALSVRMNEPMPIGTFNINEYWHLLFHPNTTIRIDNISTINAVFTSLNSSADSSLHNPNEE